MLTCDCARSVGMKWKAFSGLGWLLNCSDKIMHHSDNKYHRSFVSERSARSAMTTPNFWRISRRSWNPSGMYRKGSSSSRKRWRFGKNWSRERCWKGTSSRRSTRRPRNCSGRKCRFYLGSSEISYDNNIAIWRNGKDEESDIKRYKLSWLQC